MIRTNGTAVITGAGSGIGRALATQLAREHGMNLVLAGRRKERLEELASDLREHGVQTHPISCDVGDRNSMAGLKTATFERFGGVDLLCLNAGTATAGALVDHSSEQWNYVYGTVLMGVVHGIQEFLPAMIEAGSGHILLTASISGLIPDAFLNHGPYVSAKAAVIGMGVALREEVAARGVGVSVMVPAATQTDMVNTAAFHPSLGPSTPAPDFSTVVPRPGLPEMLSGSEVFLTPEEVARRAVVGVQQNMTFIATHTGHLPMVEEYCARITDAFKQDWPAILDAAAKP